MLAARFLHTRSGQIEKLAALTIFLECSISNNNASATSRKNGDGIVNLFNCLYDFPFVYDLHIHLTHPDALWSEFNLTHIGSRLGHQIRRSSMQPTVEATLLQFRIQKNDDQPRNKANYQAY